MTTEKQTDDRREDDLEQLQKLLLGEDLSRLNQLDQRVSDFESRVSDVAEVLPKVFERVAGDPILEAEIEKPMLQMIRSSIKRDTHIFAELLFPVIGPAIRRAVADALKSLVQRINVAMEHSFSIKGLRWRLEAARTGVPFGQVVLGHTMRYAVQETFLITRDTGLVLAHAHRDENLVLDEDAVAAMLTAIQSFIQDSLGMSADDPLRSAELGDRTLWVINGPEAILACIINGSPPRPVRDDLMVLLESIHARYGERFGETNDVLMKDMGLRLLVQQSLKEELDEPSEPATRSKAPLYWLVAIAVLISLAGWQSWQQYQQRKFESQVIELFGDQPGYLVSSSNRDQGILTIHGLRDPGAITPDTVMKEQGLADQGVQFHFKPFWSLEPALVLQRLRSSLGLTESTGLELNDGVLHVGGTLTGKQTNALTRLADSHPLIDSVELTNTRLSADEAIQLAREELGAPATVMLTQGNEQIVVSGHSDVHWYLETSAESRSIGGWELDFEPLGVTLREQLRAKAAEMENVVIFFTRQDQLTETSTTDVNSFASRLTALLQSADLLSVNLLITLRGEVDGTGTAEQNSRVARKRVSIVREQLTLAGIDPERLQSEYPRWNSGDENLAQRRVTVRITEEAGQ